jgi:integrase-like protein
VLGPFDTLKSGSDMLHREWSNIVMGRKLVDVINEVCRTEHYAYRTEETYLYWIKRYISFNSNRPPRELGAAEIQQFLSSLATEFRVSAATQNQALSAILFLYKKVLGLDLPWMEDIVRAHRPKRVPAAGRSWRQGR